MFSSIMENWELYAMLLLAIYEVVARFIPTEGNWSIVHALVKILDLFVKNKSKKVEIETDADGKARPKRKLFRVTRD